MKKFITKRRLFCLAVVVAVIVVPFLYSYFYLGAFWDPYSKLDKLPVAVVNEDKGSTINDKARNIGQEMCDQLKEDASLKFVFTDAKDAKSGTEGDEYYATITIPEDFSANIGSASEEKKQEAKVTYAPNEKRNFLASQILNRAVLQIEEETRSKVDKEIVQELVDNIQKLPGQLNDMKDGLGQLGDGSSQLLDGTVTLADGTQKLYDGTQSLVTGTKTLYDGTQTLANGTQTLANGTQTLADGTQTLAAGTTTLANGASTLSNGTSTLASGTAAYYSGMKDYKAGMTSAKDGAASLASGAKAVNDGAAGIKSGLDQIATKTKDIDQLTSGATNLAAGTAQFDSNFGTYKNGVDSLVSSSKNTATLLYQLGTTYTDLAADPRYQGLMAQITNPATAAQLQQLTDGGNGLVVGSSSIKDGAAKLSAGTANLPDLKTGIGQLDAGAATLAKGTGDLNTGAASLNTGITKLSGATDQLYEKAGEIAGGASSVNSGAAQLSSGASSVNSGAQQLNGGANDLNSGAQKLNSGAADLNSGVATLSNGVTTLNQGASDLNTGAGTLKDGMTKLNDGVTTAQNGVNDAIKDANDQLPKLNGLADYASAPVKVDQQSITTIPNYGTAFAPYFMSLSLWVGALIMFVGIYLDTEGRFKIMSRESEHKAIRAFLFQVIAFLQAVALGVVVKEGLGLKVDNVPLYYFSIILVSMSFMSIVQFLMIHLKSAGKLLSIILLILQLTSCGGTFPLELIPKFFGDLYPYMPMTYSVALFKQAITDPHTDAVLHNCLILAIILVVFMALTLVLSLVKFKKEAAEQANAKVQYES